jgi:uncharacterized membrane protein
MVYTPVYFPTHYGGSIYFTSHIAETIVTFGGIIMILGIILLIGGILLYGVWKFEDHVVRSGLFISIIGIVIFFIGLVIELIMNLL